MGDPPRDIHCLVLIKPLAILFSLNPTWKISFTGISIFPPGEGWREILGLGGYLSSLVLVSPFVECPRTDEHQLCNQLSARLHRAAARAPDKSEQGTHGQHCQG